MTSNLGTPVGSVRSTDGSAVEHTRWTVVANLADRRYIIRLFEDPPRTWST